jgi:hypothetical protein
MTIHGVVASTDGRVFPLPRLARWFTDTLALHDTVTKLLLFDVYMWMKVDISENNLNLWFSGLRWGSDFTIRGFESVAGNSYPYCRTAAHCHTTVAHCITATHCRNATRCRKKIRWELFGSWLPPTMSSASVYIVAADTTSGFNIYMPWSSRYPPYNIAQL